MRRSAIEKLELLLTDTNDININIDIERKEHLNKNQRNMHSRIYIITIRSNN